MGSITARSASTARFSFEHAIEDVDALLSLYDTRNTGLAARTYEVCKRAAMVLMLTAWESYIEDTLRDRLVALLNRSQSPADASSAFKTAMRRSQRNALPSPELPTGSPARDWRARVLAHFDDEIARLHTPNSTKIRELSSRYLGTDITSEWHWKGVSADDSASRLDAVVRQRGGLVHHGKPFLALKHSVRREEVARARRLLIGLVEATDLALGIQPETYSYDV